MAAPDAVRPDGQINDLDRCAFLDAHISEVLAAISEGINVGAYIVWSLLDNFEWSLGYDKRFGIVHVDFDTLKRTPKASFFALGDALSEN